MKLKVPCCFACLWLAISVPAAFADTTQISFAGSGVSGSVVLTYGPGTDTKYSQASEITAVSGTFTDSNLGIMDATITGLVPINHASPDSTNLLAPNDFSHYGVAAGLPPENNGQLSFDNLLWPGGSPQTATDYPFGGGVFDIYGLLFTIDNGYAVNFWSNGVLPGATAPDYGIAVVTHAASLDYVSGVTPTPEPGTIVLLTTGIAGLGVRFRQRKRA